MGARWTLVLALVASLVPAGILASLLLQDDPGPHRGLDHAMLAALLALAGLCAAGLVRLDRLERELAARRRELERLGEERLRASRLEDLARLAGGLAHEIGQPLSAARVAIEGLHYLRQLGRSADPDYLDRAVGRVGRNLIAITQVVEHLRQLAAPEAATALQELDVAALAGSVLAEREEWLRFHQVRIEWSPPPGPVPALADPVGLRLVLVNLLRNAAEAVAGLGEARRTVRLALHPGAGRTGPALAVADEGPGIDEHAIHRVFDPFFSTKAGGRGIGLCLARASAAAMGAELAVASAVGSGATFTLRLRAPPEREAR
jgi:two-component system C4-dicarboxylate transport sensor histidine kinase DctB